MRTFLSDTVNDLILGAGGSLQVISGQEATLLVARHYMQTKTGEMIHAIENGIPFFDTAFAPAPNVAQFEAAGRRRLMEVPSVIEVVSFETVQSGEVLSYTASIKDNLGEVVING